MELLLRSDTQTNKGWYSINLPQRDGRVRNETVTHGPNVEPLHCSRPMTCYH